MTPLFRTPVRKPQTDRREHPLEVVDDNRLQQDGRLKVPNMAPMGHENPQQYQQQKDKKRKKAKPSSLCITPPPLIYDKSGRTYNRRLCIGEGGFARCFQVDDANGEIYAAKTLAKAALTSEKTRSKLITEIKYHRAMKHPNIVNFIDCFEDVNNVYILLEMCSNQSLSDLVHRRGHLTETESKYYFVQLLGAISYMHSRGIIHRDLKLGNIFLDKNLDLKVGDFGLAARIDQSRPRRFTVCGTPNYISPEVLLKPHGHAQGVDMWAIGIILYAMLVGRPPFQKSDVNDIYTAIKSHKGVFPPSPSASLVENHKNVSMEARNLIAQLLHPDPAMRPTIQECLTHKWLNSGPFYSSVPANIYKTSGFYNYGSQESAANLAAVITRCGLGPNGFALVSTNTVEGVNDKEIKHTDSDHVLPTSISPPSTKDKYKPVLVDSPNDNGQQEKVAIYDSPIVGEKIRKKETYQEHIGVDSPGVRQAGFNGFRAKELRTQAPIAARTSTHNPMGAQHHQTHTQPHALSASGLPASLARPSSNGAPLLNRPASTKSVNVVAYLKRSMRITMENLGSAINSYQSKSNTYTSTEYPAHIELPQLVTRWADFEDNWGMSYCLKDGSVGVLFRDKTSMRMDPVFSTFVYYESNSKPGLMTQHRTASDTPDHRRKKKVDILQYVRRYMDRELGHAVPISRKGGDVSEGPIVYSLTKSADYIMFILTDGTLQFNFADHNKVIVFDEGKGICVITSQKNYFCWKMDEAFRAMHQYPSLFKSFDMIGKLEVVQKQCRNFVMKK